MRPDMAKVIVERPRKKGWAWNKPKGYQRRLRRYGEDGPPAREGIRACWQGRTKCLNEHLGPLRRSLAVQGRVRDHVGQYVATHVVLIDGVPCNGEGGLGYGRPLHHLRYRPWYVCP